MCERMTFLLHGSYKVNSKNIWVLDIKGWCTFRIWESWLRFQAARWPTRWAMEQCFSLLTSFSMRSKRPSCSKVTFKVLSTKSLMIRVTIWSSNIITKIIQWHTWREPKETKWMNTPAEEDPAPIDNATIICPILSNTFLSKWFNQINNLLRFELKWP